MCKMDSFMSSAVSRRSKFDRANESVLLLFSNDRDLDDDDGFPLTNSWEAASRRPASSFGLVPAGI